MFLSAVTNGDSGAVRPLSLMQTCRRGCTSNKQCCCGVLLLFANYARSAEQYQHAASFQMLVMALVHLQWTIQQRSTGWHPSWYLVLRLESVLNAVA